MTPQLTVRSTAAHVSAYVWLAFAAFNLLDLAIGITGSARYNLTSASIAALLLLGSGIAYVVGLRPAIVADEAGVTVRNPARDTRAPWPAVREVEGGTAVTVRFTGPGGAERKTRAWVLQTSPRAQAKTEARARRDESRRPAGDRSAAALIKGRTPADFTAGQLDEIRERSRSRSRSGAAGPTTAEAGAVDGGAEARPEATGSVTWSVAAAVALGVPLLLLLAVIIAGLLA
ncbi:PH domain-containing protein [Actinomadura xylanilytica]|uniref:PH domain-containing protein n=1 Tax=Actinomadura xylanilytica TaxID=887459 RepID=UPI00255B08E2|nr:PH domain-containing protein [Actinomadura xylanilytica]MDL4776141.1 PH domain-containing protein [Actinomadura xylanilytica]